MIHEALACYRDLPITVRFHNFARHKTCPFDRIEPWVPREGTIYDLGCGHGLFTLCMAISSPVRKITGVDISEEKIRIAREASRRLSNVSFHSADILAGDIEPCDAITILDVLYLMPLEYIGKIVSKCYRALKPGGALIINTTDRRPRWKFLLAYCQEIAAVKLLRITVGHKLSFHSKDELCDLLDKAGFAVQSEPIGRGYLHPHTLLVAGRRRD
ncbi:MAG: class I SAM-dependent methyltransferase [bacterium]